MTGRVMTSVGFSLLAAFLYALSNVLEQSEAEQVDREHALRPSLILRLAGRPRWVLGFASDAGGFVAGAAALSVGAVLFVQPIQAMGLMITLFLGSALRHRSVSGRDWCMALLLCAGLSLFLYEASPTRGLDVARGSHWLVAAPILVVAVLTCVGLANGATGAARGAYLGVAAAILFAASAVLTKAFVHYLGEGIVAWAPHWEPYTMAVAIGSGFVIAQSAFQAGSLSASVAAIEATEPIVSVALGVGLLRERVAIGTPAHLAAVVVAVFAVVVAIVALARSEDRLVADAPPVTHPPGRSGHAIEQ